MKNENTPQTVEELVKALRASDQKETFMLRLTDVEAEKLVDDFLDKRDWMNHNSN